MRQILQLRQIRKLQIQTVDQQPPVSSNSTEQDPGERHDDVVGEDHVVHDRPEEKSEETETYEDAESVQPWDYLLFVFLSQSHNEQHPGDEHGQRAEPREQSEYDQHVAHWCGANIDKLEADDVVAVVHGPRRRHAQAVQVEDALTEREQGYKHRKASSQQRPPLQV